MAERPIAYITTSWDDGHPRDERVAELLEKHGLKGTFYVPRQSQRETMDERRVRRLSERFEVGAHTLGHVALTELGPAKAQEEIRGGRQWIEEVTGKACAMFCPPLGKFRREHLAMARECGFAGVRTVEFLSIDEPKWQEGIAVMPTTIQAHPHGMISYVKNAARRGAAGNLWRWVRLGRGCDWPTFAERLLNEALHRGGVFHLWGHSWEIEDNDQWTGVDQVMRMMAGAKARCVTNGELCEQAGRR